MLSTIRQRAIPSICVESQDEPCEVGKMSWKRPAVITRGGLLRASTFGFRKTASHHGTIMAFQGGDVGGQYDIRSWFKRWLAHCIPF